MFLFHDLKSFFDVFMLCFTLYCNKTQGLSVYRSENQCVLSYYIHAIKIYNVIQLVLVVSKDILPIGKDALLLVSSRSCWTVGKESEEPVYGLIVKQKHNFCRNFFSSQYFIK